MKSSIKVVVILYLTCQFCFSEKKQRVNKESTFLFPSNLVVEANSLLALPPLGNEVYKEKRKVRELLKGKEREAVMFALDNFYTTNLKGKAGDDLYKICVFTLVAFEKDAYSFYKKKYSLLNDISPEQKNELWLWSCWVSNPKSFSFVIDRFLEDKEIIPYKKHSYELPMGESLRYCDRILALAQRRIEGTRDWSIYGQVNRLVRINHRDESLTQFKDWWVKNKDNLEWSAEKGKFFVCPSKEKGGGLQSIKDIISKNGLDQREKFHLRKWGNSVTDTESFCFIIDTFLAEGTVVPYAVNPRIKEPLRRCDHALLLAQKRIEGTRDWSRHDTITSKIELKYRDADLVLFKKWWAENKANLKWSEEKKKFYVDPTLEKGAGILSVKRHRNREQSAEKPHKK